MKGGTLLLLLAGAGVAAFALSSSSSSASAPTSTDPTPPDVAPNYVFPPGWTPMQQSMVTPEMTAWAVSILHDTATYPLESTTTRTFGTQQVLARVEWHPPNFIKGYVHRGVSLYIPV